MTDEVSGLRISACCMSLSKHFEQVIWHRVGIVQARCRQGVGKV